MCVEGLADPDGRGRRARDGTGFLSPALLVLPTMGLTNDPIVLPLHF